SVSVDAPQCRYSAKSIDPRRIDIAAYRQGFQGSVAPLAAQGQLMQLTSGIQFKQGCFCAVRHLRRNLQQRTEYGGVQNVCLQIQAGAIILAGATVARADITARPALPALPVKADILQKQIPS